MSKLVFVVVMALVAISGHFASAQKNVIGYLGAWANYRPGNGKFTIEHINPKLLTHVIYSFFGANSDATIKHLDSWLDINLKSIARCIELKKQNPTLKVLAAVGGWNAGVHEFSAIAATPELRTKFANEAVAFCKKFGFDGLDMDWEYPANIERGGKPEDKQNFVLLMKELYTKFKPANLTLTAAVAAPESIASVSYDIKQLANNVDFINLMAYDFHTSVDGATGQNAPLKSANAGDKLNVQSSVEYWLKQGLPPSKLNLGIPTYGRTFAVSKANQRGLGARATGAGQSGPYTQEPGMLGYNEICEMKNDGKLTEIWDTNQAVPYASNENLWVGFDNVKSIQEKCNYIKTKNLAGGMFWSLETDDFLGKCGPKFGLISALKNCL
ncbi:acidic mammalian chitinase-like [Toxorhynchites rutilus septentrionalis]|uniref:acidic mammalian chitinase-like n=1 Tax=Toxorhynchites rutilus septentrionalis TaxID=329112 RepID=UPI00247A4839|nr:acidic mammalian chitinase-like [Toxorhynchites rutilus septentrionalis]